ncbi:MAG: hypothetical protein QJR03_03010 [Sphaerobacter sp.]|nr:hypothetical protein [Sphaerobacter sp.]
MLVNASTRVLVYGLGTGDAAALTAQMVAYGTRVVAGVAAGRYGERMAGVPIYDTVADAVLFHQPTAALVTVPPADVLDACLDAIAHDIRFLVIATEGVPPADVRRLRDWAHDTATRVLGPGSAGIIAPADRVRIGPIGGADPDRDFPHGPVGIIASDSSRAAGVARLTRRVGLGVSTAVSIGAGAAITTTPLQLLPLFERDAATTGVVLAGETVWAAEIADAILAQRYTKPLIVAPPSDPALVSEALHDAGALVAEEREDLLQYLSLVFRGTPYFGDAC